MQTSQIKKGNPARRSRTALVKARKDKALDRAIELGLPWGPPILYQCPHCDSEKIATAMGHTRIGRAVPICTRCAGDVTGRPTFHHPTPQRKKRKKARDDDD
jgi:hypothetical protein